MIGEFPAPPKLHVLTVPGADPWRDENVSRLADGSHVCEHADPDRDGCMANWLRALRCASEHDTELPWSVIVSDDAIPLIGWQQHLERACTNSPAPILGLTYFGRYGQRAADAGAPYLYGNGLLWGGAIAYHRSQFPALLRFAERAAATGYPHDDRTVAAWCHLTRQTPALAARAVFGQPTKEQSRSMLGHHTAIRTPALTIEDPGPAWTTRPQVQTYSGSLTPDIHELLTKIGSLT